MAPPKIPSSSASKLDSSPPPLPVKNQTRRPGTAKSMRTLSNSSIPTLANTRLARQPSASSSSNATLVKQSPLQARRSMRSTNYPPPSSRPILSNPALDPSQDHHRSDSGRSTGSSRSTATTDSFFLPQHPHTLNCRYKDLPAPPTSSSLADSAKQYRASDAAALGLNIAIGSSPSSGPLPASQLYRSQSSVSTTPTSPEEGSGSPLGGPVPAHYPALDDEGLEGKDELKPNHVDGLDDFWQSDYSYARPSMDLGQSSLPPLMRSNAPIPPSRSQSLDPFAVPLHTPNAADGAALKASDDDHTLHQQSPPIGSVTPLVAANLQKLNSQNNSSSPSVTKLSSPVLSSPSGAPTLTKRSDDDRLAGLRVPPYQRAVTSPSSSSSAIDHRSQPNKSSSSLSTASANGHEKATAATASKRSSTSSSSSFRMTLSRQAKTLRNSFMWTPPVNSAPQSKSQERVAASTAFLRPESSSTPISQGSSPGLAVSSPRSAYEELPTTPPPPVEAAVANASTNVDREAHAKNASAASSSGKTSKPNSLYSSHSSADVHAKQPGLRRRRSEAWIDSSAPGLSLVQSSKPKQPQPQPQPQQPTDYSKLEEERPKSRLSSRLTLHNANWSMKISNLKTKKPSEATTSTSVAPLATSEATRGPSRRTKSQASLSSAATVTPANALRTTTRGDQAKRSSVMQVSEQATSLAIASTPLLTSEQTSGDAQLSPSFAQTFAFLNNHIDSPGQSPPLVAAPLPPLQDARPSVHLASEEAARPPIKAEAVRPDREVIPVEQPKTAVLQDSVPAPLSSRPQKAGTADGEDEASRAALFARLADSPEAVYKTLVFPDPKPLPASQSFDGVPPSSSSTSKKLGHKKNISLGSANLISRSARRAAADLDKRAVVAPVASAGLPLTNTTSSFATALPMFTPVDEENPFFDALTSPLHERPPTDTAISSPENAMLPTFATANEFFPSTKAEPASPVRDRSLAASQSTARISATTPSATQALPQPNRSSLGRLSGVFDTSKARTARKNVLASPPQSPRTESMPFDGLPARPETSLGFYLRNPLRRERKASLKTAVPQPTPGYIANSDTANSASPASAIRKMSSGFKLDRSTPAPRAETSLGMASPGIKARAGFSSSVLAPTKSPLARSVQPSPPSAGRATTRSTSASSLGMPASSSSSRSPQRPANPPSSFRRSPAAPSRPSVFANDSPTKPSNAMPTTLFKAPLPLTIGSARLQQSVGGSAATSQIDASTQPTMGPDTSEVRRRRTMSKPVLQPIRTSFAEERPVVRPSSAMGFRGSVTVQDRKMSQPTLDMVDDREFLEALEQVRAVQRERIQAEAQEAENKTRLARLGMMSGNHLKAKVSGSMLDDADGTQNNAAGFLPSSTVTTEADSTASPGDGAVAKPLPRHRRSASEDGKLSRTQSMSPTVQALERDLDQRQKNIVKAYADKKPPAGPPTSGLEWGVGKASGKLHDGTFVNDDDWKKEVKALFLIRELVQTERSYARHLSSLLAVVSKMQVAATVGGSSNALGVKRKSTSNLFAAYSSAYANKTLAQGVPPSHIGLLRTYLPQLIALSNSLVQRVEENPTSAGVGAAFDVLSAQLEATFVGWSSVAPDALKELRSTELAKAKSPYKIGLVPLMPRESTEVGASTVETLSNSGSSSPASGFRHSTLRMTSMTRPASPVGGAAARNELQGDGATATMPAKRSAKRRSTITSTSFIAPPRIIVAPAAKLSSSPEEEKPVEAATPSRRFGHSRSQSTFVTPTTTPVSAVGGDPWSSLGMTVAAPVQQAGGKSLTPMDIAIMPTQRIPRYGLMLRDLLRNTPPESLSHARVQRAISLIQRVAGLCDSAAPLTVVKGGGGGTRSGSATPARAGSRVDGVLEGAVGGTGAGLVMTKRG